MIKDLTVGKPWRVIPAFALPLLGSSVFQQLYNIADSLIAGKFIGEEALAAVGNAYEITLVYLAFGFGCNIGCSVVLSQLFGAKKLKDLKTAVTTTFITSFIICALLMVVGFVFTPVLLQVIKTPADIYDDSLLYMTIYTAGLPFMFFYNISNGIFSALGDSKTPFAFLAISSTANIFADILFVVSFGMGVSGVAWATFMCQGVSCVAAFITVFIKLNHLCGGMNAPLYSSKILKRILKVAVPSILQQCSISVGNIFIQRMVNLCGTATVAGYSAAIKVNNFAITSLVSLGNAMSNYAGQNIGAGKISRVKKGMKSGLIMACSVGALFGICFVFFSSPLIKMFIVNESGEAFAVGQTFLIVVSPFYFMISAKLMADGVLRGAGKMNYFMISTFLDLILRVALAAILLQPLGSVGIWLAWPAGWVISVILSNVFYLKGVWIPEYAVNKKLAAVNTCDQ